MPGHALRISKELDEEIRRQPQHIRDEFWAAHDSLASLDTPRPPAFGQLGLPGLDADGPTTRPFAGSGWIVYQVLGDCEVEVLDVHWPTQVDDDPPGLISSYRR